MYTIKSLSFTITLICISTMGVFAQKVKRVGATKPKTENTEPFITVSAPSNGVAPTSPDVKANFKGGQSALKLFISENLKYPKMALENEVQGVLIVELVIDKDGTPRFHKFVRQLGYGCEEEAKRLIKEMPKWNPALLNGKPIDYNYTLMISFKPTN
ncbi:TonB protein C-terminal [Chryseobacterium soldanellicola]|uniref:TonB protein C-terminal n=1 Tax=Chryseobacterium soldanellicola TaxID=311333 RepID=A0A1H1FUB5_9FLAO|nr:energy transducer TonB [Chryseobacterium soldanellicola]SDR04505.1 TonB protein C-terminal [Chryseobacterium soldanellicola]